MAAIFPIPYEVRPGETLPGVDPTRSRPRTVVPFDRARAARRRRAIRRRNAGIVAVAVTSFVAIVFALGVVFAVIDARSQPPVSGPAVNPPTAPAAAAAGTGTVVVVQSGDTLTSIARDLQPTGDISGLVDRLAAQHGPAPLFPGERLVVPTSGASTGHGG
jgi:hypothetical protein